MICFPNAKINLGLFVTEKRVDGYHNLETIMLPVSWSDLLEVVSADKFEFELSGANVPGNIDDISCVKAYRMLQPDFDLPPIKMHLHKIIPHGAGLGGGSADGAFAIRLLSDFFGLGLSAQVMEEYALNIGSDAPFFIRNKPALCTGRGNEMAEYSLKLEGYHFLIVFPGFQVNTAQAYSGIIPAKAGFDLRNLQHSEIHNWKDYLVNDFEQPIFSRYPVLREIKEKLYHMGALYASMSGSGSSMFGIFREEVNSRFDFGQDSGIWKGVF